MNANRDCGILPSAFHPWEFLRLLVWIQVYVSYGSHRPAGIFIKIISRRRWWVENGGAM